MPWYIFAFSAAFIWGIHYNLLSRAMTVMSPTTAYWLPTIICILGLPWWWSSLKTDFKAVMAADPTIQLSVGIIMFTSLAATTMLYKAIQLHNPVHVGLIEITYPIFVTIFAFILFQQNHFNWGTLVGGALMIMGAGVVVYSGK